MRTRRSNGRGRPTGKYHSHHDRLLEYLARISLKYGIDSKEFFNNLVNAFEKQESICNNLNFKCRNKTKDTAIFLITRNHKVIAQFHIPLGILKETDPLKAYMDTMASEVTNHTVKNPKIKDLESGMKKVNLEVRVLKIPEPKPVFTKFGTEAYVSNVLVSDETGSIKLSLWNQQIYNVSVDDLIKIENAKVASFRGNRQLRLGRSGKLTIVKESTDGRNASSLLTNS